MKKWAKLILIAKTFWSLVILILRKCMHYNNTENELAVLGEIKVVYRNASGCQKSWIMIEVLNTTAQNDYYNVLGRKWYFRLGGAEA